jgi:DNA-binding MarR family transcriptional regulator
MGVSRPMVTAHMSVLCDAGYVVRMASPDDGRSVYMLPTKSGKKLYTDYRIYLLDYTKDENWYLQNPKTLEEWKNSAKPVEEFEEIVTKSTILE